MDFESILYSDDFLQKEDFFSKIYDDMEKIVRNEIQRFRNGYDNPLITDEFNSLVKERVKDNIEYKKWMSRYSRFHDEMAYEFGYKLETNDHVKQMLKRIAFDARIRLQQSKVISNGGIIKNEKIRLKNSSNYDFTTCKMHVIWIVILEFQIHKVFKQYEKQEKNRYNKSKMITRSEEKEDFEAMKPKMCLFDLMFNNIDIYLDELLITSKEFKPNKRQRTN